MWGEGSKAVSQVVIRPHAKVPDYNYQCIAVTPNLNISLRANKTISVHCNYYILVTHSGWFYLTFHFLDIPDVTLQIGASLNKSYIRENTDIYLSCL